MNIYFFFFVLLVTFFGVSFLVGVQGGLKHGEPMWGTVLGGFIVSIFGSFFVYGGLYWFLGGPEVSALPAGEYVGAAIFFVGLWLGVTGPLNLVLLLASIMASVWGFKLGRARLSRQRRAE
ncbi:hypothetical protein AAFO92_22225 [Roseovarius sp. CAU 1744]|uniref:hypothetical protein n=1 Tax=Roseovarius sp. CAU 1744 TaxID=3140368 RepID=UPI00325AD71D